MVETIDANNVLNWRYGLSLKGILDDLKLLRLAWF